MLLAHVVSLISNPRHLTSSRLAVSLRLPLPLLHFSLLPLDL